jgi:hypothetical protein
MHQILDTLDRLASTYPDLEGYRQDLMEYFLPSLAIQEQLALAFPWSPWGVLSVEADPQHKDIAEPVSVPVDTEFHIQFERTDGTTLQRSFTHAESECYLLPRGATTKVEQLTGNLWVGFYWDGIPDQISIPQQRLSHKLDFIVQGPQLDIWNPRLTRDRLMSRPWYRQNAEGDEREEPIVPLMDQQFWQSSPAQFDALTQFRRLSLKLPLRLFQDARPTLGPPGQKARAVWFRIPWREPLPHHITLRYNALLVVERNIQTLRIPVPPVAQRDQHAGVRAPNWLSLSIPVSESHRLELKGANILDVQIPGQVCALDPREWKYKAAPQEDSRNSLGLLEINLVKVHDPVSYVQVRVQYFYGPIANAAEGSVQLSGTLRFTQAAKIVGQVPVSFQPNLEGQTISLAGWTELFRSYYFDGGRAITRRDFAALVARCSFLDCNRNIDPDSLSCERQVLSTNDNGALETRIRVLLTTRTSGTIISEDREGLSRYLSLLFCAHSAVGAKYEVRLCDRSAAESAGVHA